MKKLLVFKPFYLIISILFIILHVNHYINNVCTENIESNAIDTTTCLDPRHLNEMKEKVESLEKINIEMDQKIKDFVKVSVEKENEIENLKKQINVLNNKFTKDKSNNESKNKNDALKTDIKKLKEINKINEKQIQSLNDKVKELEIEIDERNLTSQEKINELEKEIKSLQGINNKLGKKYDQLNAKHRNSLQNKDFFAFLSTAFDESFIMIEKLYTNIQKRSIPFLRRYQKISIQYIRVMIKKVNKTTHIIIKKTRNLYNTHVKPVVKPHYDELYEFLRVKYFKYLHLKLFKVSLDFNKYLGRVAAVYVKLEDSYQDFFINLDDNLPKYAPLIRRCIDSALLIIIGFTLLFVLNFVLRFLIRIINTIYAIITGIFYYVFCCCFFKRKAKDNTKQKRKTSKKSDSPVNSEEIKKDISTSSTGSKKVRRGSGKKNN